MSDTIDSKAVMEQQPVDEKHVASPHNMEDIPIDALPKSRWERSWPVIACGAGLFSDGYLNGVSFSFFIPHQRNQY